MKIRRLNRRARAEFVLDYYAGGKRVRRWFKSRAAAEGEASALKEQKRTCGEAWIDLDPAERSDLMLLHSEARAKGVTLRQVWTAYLSGKLDAEPLQRRSLRQAIEETVAAKTGENLRDRYVSELENYLQTFASGREELPVDRVTVADVEQWFELRGEALTMRRSNLGRLSAMFDVAWRRGYIRENPCLRITPPKVDLRPPVILTPAEAKRLLETCRKDKPRLVPWLVLGLFAGVRPEELEKLRWADVDLTNGVVTIDAAASKTRRRRTVPLVHRVENLEGKRKTLVEFSPALQWLKLCRVGKPAELITPPKSTLRRDRADLRQAAGVQWQHDLLRHTSASYLLTLLGDAAKVANFFGHSVRILEANYKNLVAVPDSRLFWSLKP